MAKMNNFTTTTATVPKKESLPRSGHVNEGKKRRRTTNTTTAATTATVETETDKGCSGSEHNFNLSLSWARGMQTGLGEGEEYCG